MGKTSEAEYDDPFLHHEAWIAALARQLFRAVAAEDAKATEAALFYFKDFLVKVLGKHLSLDPRWDRDSRWLDCLGGADPQLDPPQGLVLQDTLVWATKDQRDWYEEPFEFELALCPTTGAFRSYTFRFGDNRPLSEKGILNSDSVVFPEAGGWAFVFHREVPHEWK